MTAPALLLLPLALLAGDGGAPAAGAPDAAAAGATDDARPAGCVGDELDLDKIFANKACDVPGQPRQPPPPSDLAIELSPKQLSLQAGKKGRLTVSFRNLGAAPLPLDLDMSCGVDEVLATELYRGSKRADGPQDCGGIGSACGRRTVRVTLAARGVARVHVGVATTAEVVDMMCTPTGHKPLKPGAYKLVVNTPFQDAVAGTVNEVKTRTATAKLTVTP